MTVSTLVPPPPYQSPFLINGILSPIWSNWIRQLYLQVGGTSASSISALTTAVLALQTNVSAIQTQVNNFTILEFGPNL